jgi:hypothetical protein
MFIFRKKFYLSRKYLVTKFSTAQSRGTLVIIAEKIWKIQELKVKSPLLARASRSCPQRKHENYKYNKGLEKEGFGFIPRKTTGFIPI